jgi:hypothetical protein
MRSDGHQEAGATAAMPHERAHVAAPHVRRAAACLRAAGRLGGSRSVGRSVLDARSTDARSLKVARLPGCEAYLAVVSTEMTGPGSTWATRARTTSPSRT